MVVVVEGLAVVVVVVVLPLLVRLNMLRVAFSHLS